MSKTKEETRFNFEQLFYLVSKNPVKKIGTIAIGVTILGEGFYATIAGSVCSTEDMFNKKEGRTIALKRLRSKNPKTRNVIISDKDFDNCNFFKILEGLELSFMCFRRCIDDNICDEKFKNVLGFIKKEVSRLNEAESILEKENKQ